MKSKILSVKKSYFLENTEEDSSRVIALQEKLTLIKKRILNEFYNTSNNLDDLDELNDRLAYHKWELENSKKKEAQPKNKKTSFFKHNTNKGGRDSGRDSESRQRNIDYYTNIINDIKNRIGIPDEPKNTPSISK